MELLRHALRPLHPTALLLVGCFALLFALAGKAGLLGLPLALITFSWLFKYAYRLLDDVAEGIDEPAVLSLEMVNPVEQRPLVQLAICFVVYVAARWVGGAGGVALAGLFLLVLPASVAVLGASDRVIDAINPFALARVVRGLGASYLAILAVVALYVIVLVGLERLPLWPLVKFAVAQWLLLSAFSLIGGALYERRDALGLEPMVSPERTAERETRERLKRREQMLDEVYVPHRVFDRARGMAPLQAWLAHVHGAELETDARVFVERAATWNDATALTLVARAVIARLIAARQLTVAIELFEATQARDPQFALESQPDVHALAAHAAATGRRRFASKLLGS